jgi:hypothetical protein
MKLAEKLLGRDNSAPSVAMKITQITRRDIVDAISVEKINWSGRMEETEFLSRLYDLDNLPSRDPRYKEARLDIWQH